SEPGHRSAYAELKGTWGRLHALAGRTTFREALAAADMPAASVRRAGRRRLRLAAATAAAAALAIGLILGAVLLPPGGDETQYATRVGERSMVALSCGSTLELNTDTAVEVDYSGALRRVTLLRGEAYFRVAPDPARPFVVAAGPGTIRAVGTGFVVRLMSPEAVAVTVTEGVVELANAGTDVQAGSPPDAHASRPRLRSGQRAEMDRATTRIQELAAAELARSQAWRDGMLIFDGQQLDAVVREVGRYTDIRLVIADEALASLRIGGAFRVGDVDALLEVLEKSFGIEVSRRGSRSVYLYAGTPLPNAPAAR